MSLETDRIEADVNQSRHRLNDTLAALGDKLSPGQMLDEVYDETPLAAGAIAVAIGALIGASTPLSRPEREALRGVADKAASAGADLAERGARAVGETVERAVH